MNVPSDEEIEALHRRYAPSADAYHRVFTHCRIVRDVAMSLVPSSGVDAALVRAGALLHDVGVYRLGADTPYVRHGVVGHELVSAEGWPERIARFCSHHTGVGLTRADVVAQGLPLPVADYLAESPEEELVMYADKFHSKRTPPVFVSAETYAAEVRRFGEDKVARFAELRVRFGEPDLATFAASFGHQVI